MSIKAIGFDYGGVLGTHKSVIPDIAELIEVPLEDIKKIYFENNQLSNVEDKSYDDLWVLILEHFGKLDFKDQTLKILNDNAQANLDPKVVDIVNELRAKNYKVGLLSNNTKANAVLMRNDGIEKLFDTFLISAEIGYQKPHSEAFEVLADKLGVTVNELVYIDDTAQSLRLSSEIGFTPILYKNPQQLREELITLNILES